MRWPVGLGRLKHAICGAKCVSYRGWRLAGGGGPGFRDTPLGRRQTTLYTVAGAPWGEARALVARY